MSIAVNYQMALVALTTLCLVVLIQNFLTAKAFVSGEQSPGMPLAGDHSLLSFRIVRTYQNSAESLPAFGLVVVAAMLASANPAAVNWLAAIHVLFRLAFWTMYYAGIGKITGGPRTMCHVGGLVSNIALAIVAAFALAKI